MKIPVEKISIGTRQRLDLGDLTDLDSIADKEVGLICPIIVHKTLTGYELVDGMRRLTKVKQLGWKEVEVFEKDTLTVAQKELCEFFADVARKDRTWQEQCTATYRLFHILRFEKREEGQTWTVRSMEKFCGMSKSEVHYRLKVAEGLLVEPRDEELWGLDGLYNAQKLLLARANRATTAELERRRMLAAQQQTLLQTEIPATTAVPAPIFDEDGDEVITRPEVVSPSLVPVMDTTEAKPIRIRIFGYRSVYSGEGKDFRLALTFRNPMEELECAWNALHPNGFIAVWDDEEIVHTYKQRVKLYWNRVTPSPSCLPFYDSTLTGLLMAKTDNSTPVFKPMSGNFTSMDFSGGQELERLVVHSLVSRCTEEGQTVLCLSGINPAHVVEIGRVPVFYEPNETIFNERIETLKEEYQQKFANVEFEL